MNAKILEFINSINVCVISTNEPYSASVFYIFDESSNSIIFISSENSRHIKNIKTLAVAIYHQNPIKGLQIVGELNLATQEQKDIYIKKYKMAKFALNHEIYAIKLKYLKYTDNTLILPKKLEFNYE